MPDNAVRRKSFFLHLAKAADANPTIAATVATMRIISANVSYGIKNKRMY